MPIPTSDGSLYFASGIDNSGLLRGRQEAVGIIKGMAGSISKLDVFAGLAAAGTAAFIKISKASFQLSKDLDLAMREVQTISKAAQDNFEGMKDAVVDLSTGVPDSARDLSKALYQIVSAGYDGAEGLRLLEVASKAAVGGVTDTLTAADGLTTVMNAWKISAQDSTKVADVFFTTVEKGKTTFGEIASSIAKVAPLAAAYKISFEEISAATATLTKQGAPTAEAMTQIRQAIIAANKVLGEGWSETMTFQEALVEVRKRAEESGKGMKEFIGEVEAVTAVLGLTGKNIEMATEDLEAMKNSLGASGRAFDVMSMAAENNIRVLRNRWHEKLLGFGDSLIKMFGRVAGALNSKAIVKGLREEADQARLTVLDITALSRGTEERKAAIERLQASYPEYFGNLDAEKAKNEDLLGSMKLMNEEYANKIVLQEYADELGKVIRQEDKLEKKRKQHVEALDTMAEQVNYTGLAYDELLEKMRQVAYGEGFDRLRASMGKGWVAGLRGTLDFLDSYSDKLNDITSQKGDIEEAKNRILELLDQASGEAELNVKVNFEGGGEQPGGWEFSEEEMTAFQDQIQEAKKAYDEWNRYRKTSLADELKAEYDQYLEHGEDYEEYLNAMLKAFKGNAQARMLIMKQLAELEAAYLEATEKAMEEFYKGWGEKIENSFKNNIDQVKKSHDKWIDSLDKAVQTSLKNEKTANEAAKAYIRFGKVVFLTDKELQDLEETTRKYIDVLGNLGAALSNFGAQGNEAMSALGEGINGIVNILSGNEIGGAMQLINALNRYVESRQEAKRELAGLKEEAHVAALNHEIDKLNKLLDEHLYLLNKLQGNQWLMGARESIDILNDSIDQLNVNIRDTQLRWRAPKDPFAVPDPDLDRWTDWMEVGKDIAKMTNEEIQQFLDEYWDVLLPGPRDQLQQWLDEVKEAGRAIDDLLADIEYETLGFDASAITDNIVSAFEEGKIAAEDFANTFEDLMKQAMIASFKREFLDAQIQRFYKNMYAFMTDEDTEAEGKSFGGFSEFELNRMRQWWNGIIENAKEGWEALEEIMGGVFGGMEDDPNSLAGAIRRSLTEETGSLLAGKMNMLIMDVRDMKLVQHAAADTLMKIEQNTSFNRYLAHLEAMRYDLNALKTQMLG